MDGVDDIPGHWATVFTDAVAKRLTNVSLTRSGPKKDSNGESICSVRVSSGDGQWMEFRIFGHRYWVCNDLCTTTTLFLQDYGDPAEAATNNAEDLDSVAEMIAAYFRGSYMERRDRRGRVTRRVMGLDGESFKLYF